MRKTDAYLQSTTADVICGSTGQAECYDEKNIKNGILVRELSPWTDFINFVRDPKESWSTLIYRGQANADWKVTSTLDRLEQRFPTKPNLNLGTPGEFNCSRVNRTLQLERFKEIARGRLAFHIPETEDDEWWALAQHHGMATPMLDWTYSPFVALYFAFEQEKCDCDGDWRNPAFRAVYAFAHHIRAKRSPKNPPKAIASKWPGNYRLNGQAGLFLRMPEPKYDAESKHHVHVELEAYIGEHFAEDPNPEPVLQKFIIPDKKEDDRIECLRFLDHMNINRASLFPDLDGAARYVNDLWEVNWDKAIGVINDTSRRRGSALTLQK